MGISTFVHLLSDDEIALLLELKAAQNGEFDGVIKALIHALCERPHFHNDEEDRGITVDFADALRKELEKEAGTGNAIRLEQKTKFWEAKIDGTCVEVVYGKKKTKGQTNKHEAGSAAAARDYFDKKVHEKKRGGYKQVKVADPVADMKKSLLEKLGSSAESSSKKAKPVLRHRADFDKCCELLTFLTAHALALPIDQLEVFGSLFGDAATIGDDVCYGPAYVYSAAAISQIAPQILDLSVEKVLDQFQHVKADDCYGGLVGCTFERGIE